MFFLDTGGHWGSLWGVRSAGMEESNKDSDRSDSSSSARWIKYLQALLDFHGYRCVYIIPWNISTPLRICLIYKMSTYWNIRCWNGRILHVLEIVVVHSTVNTLLYKIFFKYADVNNALNSRLNTNCVKLHFFKIVLPNVVSPVVPMHTLINVNSFFLYLQGRMLLAWRRLVQERQVPSLCQSCSPCWPHHRGFTHLCSLLPGSWPFRSLSSLRPLALALVLSVVCRAIFFSFAGNWLFWVCVLMHISCLQRSSLEVLIWCHSLWFWLKNLTLLLVRQLHWRCTCTDSCV